MHASYSFDYARLRRLAFFATLGIAAAITILSLISNASVPSVGGSDKLKHFIAYAALATPMTIWFGPHRVLRVVAIAVGFGLCLEFAQGTMSAGRTASFGDAVANTLGALSGAGLIWFITKPRTGWRRPQVRFLPK